MTGSEVAPHMTKLMIIVGSVREGRVGLPIAEWAREEAEKTGRFDIDFVDLRELALPFMDEPNHPRLMRYTKPHTRSPGASGSPRPRRSSSSLPSTTTATRPLSRTPSTT